MGEFLQDTWVGLGWPGSPEPSSKGEAKVDCPELRGDACTVHLLRGLAGTSHGCLIQEQ